MLADMTGLLLLDELLFVLVVDVLTVVLLALAALKSLSFSLPIAVSFVG